MNNTNRILSIEKPSVVSQIKPYIESACGYDVVLTDSMCRYSADIYKDGKQLGLGWFEIYSHDILKDSTYKVSGYKIRLMEEFMRNTGYEALLCVLFRYNKFLGMYSHSKRNNIHTAEIFAEIPKELFHTYTIEW